MAQSRWAQGGGRGKSRRAAISTNQPSRSRAQAPGTAASWLYLARPQSVLIQRSTQAGGGGGAVIAAAGRQAMLEILPPLR